MAFNTLDVLMCFSKHWTQELVKMPWPFSESIKKRACRYLLHRYLGNFLQEKLSLDQLSLDLYQGTGSLAQVPLDKWVSSLLMWCWSVFDSIWNAISPNVGWSFYNLSDCLYLLPNRPFQDDTQVFNIKRSHNPLSLKQVLLDNLVRNTLEEILTKINQI